MVDDKTMLIPWKPTPTDDNKTVAYNLINAINFSLQRLVAEQEQINNILYHSVQSTEDILANMGTDGSYWMNCYNESVTYVTRLAALVNKPITEIAPVEITTVTTPLTASLDGTIKRKIVEVIIEEPLEP